MIDLTIFSIINTNTDYMNKKFVFLFIGFILGVHIAYTQQSAIYTNDLVLYNQARDLYNNKHFLAAQTLFTRVKNTAKDVNIIGDCAYYEASCAVWLNQAGADYMMENFVEEYPLSTKRNSAYLDVANYYFDNGKYSYARKWYDKVDAGSMNRKERERYEFNNGYAYFTGQRFKEAAKYFESVQNTEAYGAQAKYYLGFIAYEGDNYLEANELFDEVKDLEKYNKNLSYFQSDMSFKSGKFQEAINSGLEQLPKSNAKEKSELNKIIGESYFNLKEYDKAIPYLKAYKGRIGKWSNTDYYLLGYAYYKQGDYGRAISEFNKIIGGNNSTAQNAYYHLAESYLKLGQKQQALNAFKNASEMDFEPQIKEDAFYNYAKLSYEIGNSYTSIPEVLQAYLEGYPNSSHKEEIKELLLNSFVTSKNYKAAVALLEANRILVNKEVYQKVTFYRGLELYESNDFLAAKTYFDKSLSKPLNKKFVARATYWNAESSYLLENYDEALTNFLEFQNLPLSKSTSENEVFMYHLGYTYFKLKQYDKAILSFEKFLEKTTITLQQKIDANMRLGDSNFISRKYWPAMEAYNRAIELGGHDADYAHFQKAISYGFVGKNDKKIADLNAFLGTHTKSAYLDDALYELGNVYVAEKQNEKGIKAYNRLQTDMPSSSFVSKSLLKEGLIYYNSDQGNKALEKFKTVVAKYPATPEAKQAVRTAREVYVDLGRTDEYATWVKGLDFVEVTDADLDNTLYEAAEKQYVENNENAAISGLEKYLNQFPKGLHALQSHYYLGELYEKKDKPKEAIPHYEYVLTQEGSTYQEQVLSRLSQLYLEDKAYAKAIPLLEKLEKTADFPQNIIFAQSNLMKAKYQQEKYSETVSYAEKVLENPKIQNDVKSDAQVFIARSAMKTANEARAKTAYIEVQKIAGKGELGAEALYFDAYFKHREKDYKGSNAKVQQLAKDFSGYKYYGAKGLLLMAKNFYGLKDAYQATYILESVIKNFEAYPDVVSDAKETLTNIKATEAKTNSSIRQE